MIFAKASIAVAALVCFLSSSANAQTCASAADAGKLFFNERYIFCDGAAWQEVDNGPTANTCTMSDAGKLEYNGGIMRFCNGRNWRTSQGAANGSCAGTTAGTFLYSAGSFQFCNGTTWYKMLQVPPATIHGYILRTDGQTNGNLGGLAGADAFCLSDLTARSWKGKATAQANGQLVAAKVKAFMCDNTTCNNLVANSTYQFGRSGSSSSGGFWMTTDALGRGPQDNSAWQAINYFNAGSGFWSGHRDSVSSTLWNTTTTGSNNNYTCNNWGNGTSSFTGVVSTATSNGSNRWDQTSNLETCDSLNYLVCIVNP